MAFRTAVLQPPVDVRGEPGWVALADGQAAGRSRSLPSTRRVVGRFVAANLVAVLLVLGGGVWASGAAAESEGIADAKQRAETLAILVVEPNLTVGLLDADPNSDSTEQLDRVLGRLSDVGLVRVKIWTTEGLVIYSDEHRLIGQRFTLDSKDREALAEGTTRAQVTDLKRAENRFDRSADRRLEVYRAVATPSGQTLGLETYSSYEAVTKRRMDIWLKFAPISVSVVLAFVLMQLPLAHRMVAQLRATHRERELLRERALDASTEERRRIAGNLHDGIVQDVSASSLLVAGAADRLREGSSRDREVAGVLQDAAVALRESVGSLRSLLVEIYPPTLERAGLATAVDDLAARLGHRGIDVRVRVPNALDVPLETATLLFRVAQETLLNVAKHAQAEHVDVTVFQLPKLLVLEITDDGVGFDLDAVRRRERGGHLGLSVLGDLATAVGARLDIRTAPGAGTCLRLEVTRP